jgi:competence protein ComEA
MKTFLYVVLLTSLLLITKINLAVAAPLNKDAISSQVAITTVNINNASLQELAALPGIGEKKAAAIIHYRTQEGEFNAIEDLVKVRGIGKKLLKKLHKHLVIE